MVMPFQYLWPQFPATANRARLVFAALWCLATPYFARLVLTPERYSWRVSRSIDGLLVLGALAIATAAVTSVRSAKMVASATAVVNGTVLLASGAAVWS